MSNELALLGLLIGCAAYLLIDTLINTPNRRRRKLRSKIFVIERKLKRAKEDESMRRHLQELESDIQRGRMPYE